MNELLSKQIPRQRAERPNSREHYPAISSESEGEDSPGLYLQGVLWLPLQQTLFFWAFPSVIAGSTLPPWLWGGEPRSAAGAKGSFAGRRWERPAGPSKPNLLWQSCGPDSELPSQKQTGQILSCHSHINSADQLELHLLYCLGHWRLWLKRCSGCNRWSKVSWIYWQP